MGVKSRDKLYLQSHWQLSKGAYEREIVQTWWLLISRHFHYFSNFNRNLVTAHWTSLKRHRVDDEMPLMLRWISQLAIVSRCVLFKFSEVKSEWSAPEEHCHLLLQPTSLTILQRGSSAHVSDSVRNKAEVEVGRQTFLTEFNENWLKDQMLADFTR